MTSLLEYLSQNLGINQRVLHRFIRSAPYRYKRYNIPKRKPGKFREIAQPSKELKVLQLEGVEYLKSFLSIHSCATAYIQGQGIKRNALCHVNNDYLLKMDFAQFFPSIKPAALIEAARSANSQIEIDDEIWSRLFFYKPTRESSLRLSIGAPSSPFISNAVMIEFDRIIDRYCNDLGISFTRYADDLAFSTSEKNILFDVPAYLESVIKKLPWPTLTINTDKTVFSSKKHNRHVTGLVITNDSRISLGRSRKRMISAMLHKSTLGLLSAEDNIKLKGLLAFCSDVEPLFLGRLARKYGKDKLLEAQRFKFE